MKKRYLFFLLFSVLCLGGCQHTEDMEAEERIETIEKEALEESFDTIDREFSTLIANVLSKEWTEVESQESYVFEQDGTGTVSGEPFSYFCGFSEENDIILKLIMDDTEEERFYTVSVDETGYGLYLDGPGTRNDLYLMQDDVEILELSDERAKGLLGQWKDKSENEYSFRKDGMMTIKGSERESEGTFSVVIWKEDDSILLTLVSGGNALEYEYEFSDEDTLQLWRKGSEEVHTWVRAK